MACCPSFRMCMACLIHLVVHLSYSIQPNPTRGSTQPMDNSELYTIRCTSRYRRNEGVVDGGSASVRWSLVPTPVEMSVDETRRTVNVQSDGWVVVVAQPSAQLNNEAQYLSGLHSSFNNISGRSYDIKFVKKSLLCLQMYKTYRLINSMPDDDKRTDNAVRIFFAWTAKSLKSAASHYKVALWANVPSRFTNPPHIRLSLKRLDVSPGENLSTKKSPWEDLTRDSLRPESEFFAAQPALWKCCFPY